MEVYIHALLDLLFPPREDELLVRTCLSLSRVPRCVGKSTTLLPYQDPLVRACVVEAKFYHNQKALRLLGDVARELLADMGDGIVVPIPISRKRQRERGYNQVEEILKAGTIPFQTLLKKTRHTEAQMELSRAERLVNVKGVFLVRSSASHLKRNTHLILIDDVTTTGSTLREAEAALRAASFTHITTLALAH